MVSEPGQPANLTVLRAPPVRSHYLPVPPDALIGREAALAAARARIAQPDTRLLTLTGPGGTGKTRLALALAAGLAGTFADGVCLVPLAAITDPALVAIAIAQALEVREGQGVPLVEALTTALHPRHLLLLLDNFEQVGDAAPLVADLLAACPDLKILVTSRALLHVRGEQAFPVHPLDLPDPLRPATVGALSECAALQLFVERAQRVRPDFELTEENAAAVADICARLDGLPLAIELAAARVQVVSPQGMLSRLGHRLTLLTGGARDLPPRQRTLRNAIRWSYDLLDDAEQRLFRRLAVFTGGCTLATAEIVCHTDPEPGTDLLDVMASLVEQSLVRRADGPGGELRFSMLETVREFATDQLMASGEVDMIYRRLARLVLAWVEPNWPVRTATPYLAYARLAAEQDNVRAALRWAIDAADAELALELVGALYPFWYGREAFSESGSWAAQALALPGAAHPTILRARALSVAAAAANTRGDLQTSWPHAQESVAICRALGIQDRDLLFALSEIQVLATAEPPHVWRRDAEACIPVLQATGDVWGQAYAVMLVGFGWRAEGRRAEARPYLEESERLYQSVGDGRMTNRVTLAIALSDLLDGQVDAARARLEQALARARAVSNVGQVTRALIALGFVSLAVGETDQAGSSFAEAVAVVGDAPVQWATTAHLLGWAAVFSQRGDLLLTARLAGAADAHRAAHGARVDPAYAAIARPNLDAARAALRHEAFATAQAAGAALSLPQAMAEATAAWDAITVARAVADARTSVVAPSTDPVPSTQTLPGHLTARELDVLRLVAGGASNQAIADQFVLSIKTVERHIANLYAKIGAHGRVDATTFAHRHHLL